MKVARKGTAMTPSADDFNGRSVLLLLVLGLVAIGLSAVLGRGFVFQEFVYEIGVVLLSIALIEQVLVRLVRRLAERESELARLSAELDESSKRSRERLEEFTRQLDGIKLDHILTSIRTMDDLTRAKLEMIHCATDPAYAKLVRSRDR